MNTQDLIHSVSFELEDNGMDTDRYGWVHNGYTATLSRGNVTLDVLYRQGTAHTSAPDLEDVVRAMVADRDAFMSASDADEFASMFGYADGTDVYNACAENADKLAALYGEDLPAVVAYLTETE
jgi:hypothetical protein